MLPVSAVPSDDSKTTRPTAVPVASASTRHVPSTCVRSPYPPESDATGIPQVFAVRTTDPSTRFVGAAAAVDGGHPRFHTLGQVLRQLGVHDEVAPRLKTAPNGATAMRALAASRGRRPIGCTQATEIRSTPRRVVRSFA